MFTEAERNKKIRAGSIGASCSISDTFPALAGVVKPTQHISIFLPGTWIEHNCGHQW